MSRISLIAAAALLMVFLVVHTNAQQQARPGTQSPTAAATGNPPNIPSSKVALVNTDAFQDEKVGITRLVNALRGVEREFQPRKTDLDNLRNNITRVTEEINKAAQAGSVVDPRSLQQKNDQLDSMKRDFERKGQDAQLAFNKRVQEVAGPIYDDIGKELDEFAKQHGITLMLDSAKLAPAIIMATDSMDITLAFIAAYNRKNPGTAAAR